MYAKTAKTAKNKERSYLLGVAPLVNRSPEFQDELGVALGIGHALIGVVLFHDVLMAIVRAGSILRPSGCPLRLARSRDL